MTPTIIISLKFVAMKALKVDCNVLHQDLNFYLQRICHKQNTAAQLFRVFIKTSSSRRKV